MWQHELVLYDTRETHNLLVKRHNFSRWFLRVVIVLLHIRSITSQDIIFGQSAALSGENALLGTQLSIGIRAAFAEVNLRGGVSGRMLKLITLDDGYEPTQAVNNTLQFLNDSTIFGLMGYIGTQNTLAALPYITNSSFPLIGPMTGTLSLRLPFIKNVINVRPSYSGTLIRKNN
jgi:branched-chain amino acid transport system substrate-binding protein